MDDKQITHGLKALELEFGVETVARTKEAVGRFTVEVPSWVFGEFGGGRFGSYMPPGFARTIEEKLDDARFVHQLTGANPSVGVHVLWDLSENGRDPSMKEAEKVSRAAVERGLRIGSISPTYFLEGSFRGSLTAIEPETVDRYIEQTLFAAAASLEHGGSLLTLWLPDGSLYPGQVELGDSMRILKTSLQRAYQKIDPNVTVLIEYKHFEPGTYSTAIPDWGAAALLAKSLGPNAGVLVDLGHHQCGKNIEQIVARLLVEQMLGGFHFNTRYAADDDQAVEPSGEMARILYELVRGGVVANEDPDKDWAYMIDQCSARENRIQALLHTVDSLHISLARAMLVDRERLGQFQREDEILLANRTFNDALLNADVRPLVAAARLEKNLPADPVRAYFDSGYQRQIEQNRT